MAKWENVLETFLEEWKHKSYVTGALVCGSFVTGMVSKRSDIDLHIILSNKIKWRERGNKIIRGILVEYFANPPKQIKKYFQDDFEKISLMSQTQFATGKIIFDKNGDLTSLVNLAKNYLRKNLPRMKDSVSIKQNQYIVWDNLDNVEDSYESNAPDFNYVYHNFLRELYLVYLKFLGHSTSGIEKTYRVFTNKNYAKKYLQMDFPDKEFEKLFVSAIVETDRNKMVEIFKRLTNHALGKMGKFDINGLKIRSKLKL